MAGGAPLICGVDLGTSSIKAVVFSLDGDVVASGSQVTPIVTLGPGAAEFDPDALWTATAAAIRAAIAGLDDGRRVRAIAVASFGESGIALDKSGRPVAMSHAWYDRRPAAQTDQLRAAYGATALGLKSGMRLDPMPGLAKIMWLRDTDPDGFGRMTHWLMASDYVAWRLSGEMATEPTITSRMMAFDLEAEDWNTALLGDLGLASMVAPMADNGQALGPVTGEAAGQTGLAEDCVVTTGGHDHILGALAAGAIDQRYGLDSIGTAEAYLRAIDRPVTDPRVVEWDFEQGVVRAGRTMRFMVGGLITASACVEWFRQAAGGQATYDELITDAEAAPPGAHGAVFVPHLRMGSPPDVSAMASGAFLGLTTETDRGCLFRAVLEGMAMDLLKVAEHSAVLAATVGTPAPERVRVIGGGARNRLLLELKAAAYNLPLEVMSVPEATSLGAALLAGLGAGLYPDIDTAVDAAQPEARLVMPAPALAETYEALHRTRYLPAVEVLRQWRPVGQPGAD